MMMLPLAVTSLLIGSTLSAETFWGRCPTVTGMENFDMEKFEGFWYVVETFDPGEWCKTWNITKGVTTNSWKIVEDLESGAIHTVGLSHSAFNTGTLSQPNKRRPAELRSFWPISAVAGDASFVIHQTDYKNYAGVFECQNVGLFHRQNGIVLSRTPQLKGDLRQNARVLHPDILVAYYKRVEQGNCKYNEEEDSEADSEGEIESGYPYRPVNDYSART